ncbi:MAG: transporter [Flavobacteriales bacterium]|nr:transporter [Flavobacteriales bacterium]
MNKVILFLFVSLLTNTICAQFSETVSSDRPGQAFAPNSVGKYVIQSQTGIDFGGYSGNANSTGNSIAPNTFIRYGITKKIELNTAWEFRNDSYKDNNFESSTNGLSFSSVGTRLNVFEGNGNSPAIGILALVKLPILAQSYNFNNIAPRLLVIAGGSLSEKFAYILNFGIDFDGNGTSPSGLYVANLGYSISPKFSTFIENYGSFGSNYFDHRFDTGLGYLINNNIQLDIYGGFGNNNDTIDYFTSLGVTWRITSIRDKHLNNQPN